MFSAHPASASDRVAALEVLFHHLPPGERSQRISRTLPQLGGAPTNKFQLFVVKKNRSVIGAMMMQALPGGMGVVWPPMVISSLAVERLAGENALLEAGRTWLQKHGVTTAQALLAPEDAALGEPLLRQGFLQPTRLWYLRHELRRLPERPTSSHRLSFHSYDPENRDLFQQTLLHTYEGTMDFPELNGRRSLEDVLAGLQGAGFDPKQWWLAESDHRAVGVLLLGPDDDGWELQYMGLLPEARRQGFGTELVAKALAEAAAKGAGSVILSVDARNEPARALYSRMGFQTFGAREVFLALW